MQDRDELIARAIEHAEAYDTPKADDPRRRYTPAQMEIAVRHALAALESRPAPTEERYRHKKRGTCYTLIGEGRGQGIIGDEDQVTIYRGDDGAFWVRRSFEFHDGRFEQIATDTTPSRDEEGSVDREAIARTLFKRFKERAACRLPEPKPGDYALDRWENLPRSFKRDFYLDADAILALKTSTPETQTVEGGGHIPVGMKPWHGDVVGNAPNDWDGGPVLLRCGDLVPAVVFPRSQWQHGQTVSPDCHIIAYTPKPTPPERAKALEEAARASEKWDAVIVAIARLANEGRLDPNIDSSFRSQAEMRRAILDDADVAPLGVSEETIKVTVQKVFKALLPGR